MSPYVAGTTPYPWPFDGDLSGARTALLVLAPVGSGPASPAATVAVSRMARAVRRAGGIVVAAATAQPSRPGWRQRRPEGSALGGLLAGEPADLTVRAGGLDAFYGSDLDLVLRTGGITRLLLAGVGLETTVHSTMRDANDRGYECLLVVDACDAVEEELTGASVSMVEMSGGIFGAVGRTADVLAALGQPVPGVDREPHPHDLTEGALR